MSAFTGSASDTASVPGAGADLLAALLDGMDAALCAFAADGTVTHWNREAERILGWSAAEAVGRHGFEGWAARPADAEDVLRRLMGAMNGPGRQVHELALLRKDGGRVLVRSQSAGVRGADGAPAGVYCAFSEVHVQLDLERSVALSEALFDDAPWGVVLVDADLRPATVNGHAARAFGTARTALLGRPLGDVIVHGAEELEGALQHVLAEGTPPTPAEVWVTLRTAAGERRRCWRSGFVRLASPMAEEPVPLGVAWLFQDVTEERLAIREADRMRFRWSQLHRAGAAAAECEDPAEAMAVLLDFTLAGFADHALVDRVAGDRRLTRAFTTPVPPPGPASPVVGGNIPLRYGPRHPALQAWDRVGTVRASAGRTAEVWADAHLWPGEAAHAICVALRSRGRTLGVVTFLRSSCRPAFEREDVVFAEAVASRVAAVLDLPPAAETSSP
ncbi:MULTISPECIES: PAS domain-containing protein [unclassified Streptomyces]|uniref:PAS domain-containing protein n=1 Tax=unclassified Streptomyces TaxID=2593676 RepID=UPI0016617774|nr:MULTISPECIES: PAS domain-containing protein [unclassified Streptomyces]MBD0707235.1 diguanylate cyclase [Streptomyces sp. CBMA291]MBD0713723.1 diguanylate cyclase [Streptomyces sp. CBMA370]